MSRAWQKLLDSPKFIAMVGGILVLVLKEVGLNIDDELANQIVYLLIAYIVGKGIEEAKL